MDFIYFICIVLLALTIPISFNSFEQYSFQFNLENGTPGIHSWSTNWSSITSIFKCENKYYKIHSSINKNKNINVK